MKLLYIFGILFLEYLQLTVCLDCTAKPKNTEMRLKQKLLCSYDKDSRPTADSKNGTVVKIRMFVKSFSFSDYSGNLNLRSWLGMLWSDNHLKWDAAEYDGLESITIQSDEIWMPDLSIYNSRYQSDETIITPGATPIETTQFDEACTATHCLLHSNGQVYCIPPCEHSGNCHGIYTNWPFDIQNCTLHFGSWMHKGSEISYKAETIKLDNEALIHNEWKIVAMNYKNMPGNYSCCPNETYPSIKINVVIQRHAAAETAYIITPAFILTVINLAGLWLSPACTERLILNVVSLLSHFTFQQQLSWVVPRNGDVVPSALTFFRDSMIIATILLLQTISLRGMLSCKSDTPNWIKSTTDSLRGNRIGQLMFTNPYLINKGTPFNNEDSSNLVEEQPTAEINQQKLNETTSIWITTVRLLDSLMFTVLLITYIILLMGWLPTSGNKFPNAIKADVIELD